MAREFVGILGDRGSFKSCFMTYLLADAARHGRPVVANYRLHFPPQYPTVYMPFTEIARVARDVHSTALKGAAIGADELGVGADSYDFLAETPRAITSMVAQLRKDHALCYYTAQRFGMVAKRLRDQTDGYALCEDLDAHKPAHSRHNCDGVSRITILDDEYRYVRAFTFNGKPWYQYYNTDEKVLA